MRLKKLAALIDSLILAPAEACEHRLLILTGTRPTILDIMVLA
jgi:hypothetical protein